MKIKTALFWMLLFLILPVITANAANVSVTVPNIENDQGTIRVFVCASDEFLGDTCHYKKAAPAKTGSMNFVIKNVPPGTYAIEVYHDENDNGKIDFGFMGLLPEEAYGFSRLGSIYSEPKFTEAAFHIDDPQATLTIPLHYP